MNPTFEQVGSIPRTARDALRRDPAARSIVRAWRRLSGGGHRTLVACSGGADSVALALTLGLAAPDRIVIGHVVHDMRPAAEAHADRDAVADLAARLGLPMIERVVHLPAGNQEAGARRVRLNAFAEVAAEGECRFVATAHHADDQLETMLMALVRGAGVAGLSGMADRRPLGADLFLIRPMLEIERHDAERICRLAGVHWRHDATNDDANHFRAAIRRQIVPQLRRLKPHAARRAADAARWLGDAKAVVNDRVEIVFGDQYTWPRKALAHERRIVIGAGLKQAHARLTAGTGADRISRRRAAAVIDAILDGNSHRREFDWPCSVVVEVSSGLVVMKRTDAEA